MGFICLISLQLLPKLQGRARTRKPREDFSVCRARRPFGARLGRGSAPGEPARRWRSPGDRHGCTQGPRVAEPPPSQPSARPVAPGAVSLTKLHLAGTGRLHHPCQLRRAERDRVSVGGAAGLGAARSIPNTALCFSSPPPSDDDDDVLVMVGDRGPDQRHRNRRAHQCEELGTAGYELAQTE